jgi:hypothetical protein
VTPSELLDQDVTVQEDLANQAWMVASDLIVFYALIFTVVFFIQPMQKFIQRPEFSGYILWLLVLLTIFSAFVLIFFFIVEVDVLKSIIAIEQLLLRRIDVLVIL